MDFITRLPRSSSGYDTNWVIVDRLTKSAHFLAIQEDYKMGNLARIYIDEIVAGHGMPVSIISDHDGRFTSRSPVLWAEIRESRLIGPELVQETPDKVVLTKEKLKAARDRQKSYADNRLKPLELSGDLSVFVCVTFEGVDAHLEERHVSIEELRQTNALRFVEEPVEIIDREVKSLKHNEILSVKVHWNSKRGHDDFIKTKYPH
ncbi:putative reverse transcriptase domain-containing protein [Tanacetum coccineum]